MRILVLSDFYPPYFRGGYELGCRSVVEALRARGHQVKVLTSTQGVETPEDDGAVYRWLRLDPRWKSPGQPFRRAHFVADLFRKEKNNQRALRRLCKAFRPDVVYAWKLQGISISLPFVAQKLGLPVCYFVLDDWLLRWEADPFCWVRNFQPRSFKGRFARALMPLVPRALGLVSPSGALPLTHAQFASPYLKQRLLQAGAASLADAAVADAPVIPFTLEEGTLRAGPGADSRELDLDRIPYLQRADPPRRLLYLGKKGAGEGMRTVLEAVQIVATRPGLERLTLTIAGEQASPEERAQIRDLVERTQGLESRVCVTDLPGREEWPSLFREHDVLLVGSAEGGLVLEAMAAGLAVVGAAATAAQDGTAIRGEINALVFPDGNPKACAEQLMRLLASPVLFEQIRRTGRRTAEDLSRFAQTIDRIEESLWQVAERGRAAAP